MRFNPPYTDNPEMDSFLHDMARYVSDLELGIPVNKDTGFVGETIGTRLTFVDQYLHVKFAMDPIGTSFGDAYTSMQYFGLHNSPSSAESSLYFDYAWYGASFGASNKLFYKNLGARSVILFIGTAAPDSTYIQVLNPAIDLDLLTALADGSVTTTKMADGAVTTIKLADLSVTTPKLVDSAVSALKLAADAVTTVKIVDSNVTAVKLAADSVTTVKIVDSNVTAVKLATDAVETAKIKALNVTEPKLADNAVINRVLANASVTIGKISATGTPDGTKYLDGSGSWSVPAGTGGGGTTSTPIGMLAYMPTLQIFY